MNFLSFIEDLFQSAVRQSHLSPLAVKGIGIILLLLFLLYAVRQPGKFLKVLVVVAIFFALSYVAYDVVQLGVERSKEIERHQPGLSTE